MILDPRSGSQWLHEAIPTMYAQRAFVVVTSSTNSAR